MNTHLSDTLDCDNHEQQQQQNQQQQQQMLPQKRHANLSPPPCNGSSSIFRYTPKNSIHPSRSSSQHNSNENGSSDACCDSDDDGGFQSMMMKITRSSEDAESSVCEEYVGARAALHASFDSSLFSEGRSDPGNTSGSRVFSSKKKTQFRNRNVITRGYLTSSIGEENLDNCNRPISLSFEFGNGGMRSGGGFEETIQELDTISNTFSSRQPPPQYQRTISDSVIGSHAKLPLHSFQQKIKPLGSKQEDNEGTSSSTTFTTISNSIQSSITPKNISSLSRITPIDLKSDLLMTSSSSEEKHRIQQNEIGLAKNQLHYEEEKKFINEAHHEENHKTIYSRSSSTENVSGMDNIMKESSNTQQLLLAPCSSNDANKTQVHGTSLASSFPTNLSPNPSCDGWNLSHSAPKFESRFRKSTTPTACYASGLDTNSKSSTFSWKPGLDRNPNRNQVGSTTSSSNTHHVNGSGSTSNAGSDANVNAIANVANCDCDTPNTTATVNTSASTSVTLSSTMRPPPTPRGGASSSVTQRQPNTNHNNNGSNATDQGVSDNGNVGSGFLATEAQRNSWEGRDFQSRSSGSMPPPTSSHRSNNNNANGNSSTSVTNNQTPLFWTGAASGNNLSNNGGGGLPPQTPTRFGTPSLSALHSMPGSFSRQAPSQPNGIAPNQHLHSEKKATPFGFSNIHNMTTPRKELAHTSNNQSTLVEHHPDASQNPTQHLMEDQQNGDNTKPSDASQCSSISSPPSTPFRFTSFPASLPRVNPRSSSRTPNAALTPARKALYSTGLNNANTIATINNINVHGNSNIGSAKMGIVPGTVRKRMIFNDNEMEEDTNHPSKALSHRKDDDDDDGFNTSQDDSHNTSISSLSADGTTSTPTRIQRQQASFVSSNQNQILNSGTTSRAVWLSPIMSDTGASGHSKLFIDHDENMILQDDCPTDVQFVSQNKKNNDDGKEEILSPHHGDKNVVGTRLNFNSLMSPGPTDAVSSSFRNRTDHDTDDETTPTRNIIPDNTRVFAPQEDQVQTEIAQPYEQTRTSSFPSVCTDNSISYHQRTNSNPGEDADALLPDPFRADAEAGIHGSNGNRRNVDVSLSDENFGFHFDSTQCSPIATVAEDGESQVALEERVSLRGNNDASAMEKGEDNNDDDDVLMNNCKTDEEYSVNRQMNGENLWRNQSSVPPRSVKLSPRSSSVTGDVSSQQSNQSSTISMSSSSNTSKARKLRPMPDMSAFDIGSTATLSTFQNAESVETGEQSGNSTQPQQSPVKFLCPPTPVRTPAWAHNGGMSRQNSLIATKILAACAPQTLEELSSFENSFMEDEKGSSLNGEQNPNSLAVSFSAVMEGDEKTNASASSGRSMFCEDMEMEKDSDRKHPRSSFKSVKSRGEEIDGTCSKIGKASAHFDEVGSATISFDADFDNLGRLGSGTFGDVFKARAKSNNNVYAVKRNRRQFRGKRDREQAMAEVLIMQRLQTSASPSGKNPNNLYCLYVLLLIRAWQEDGHLFCQTELCCRDTSQQLLLSLTTNWESASKIYPSLSRNLGMACQDKSGHLVPESTVWKIFHDVSAGLYHIHSHGIVHHDIKPLNILFASHHRLGALCKIGDFGMAGDSGTVEDGHEGDNVYMPQELLTYPAKDASGDIFSFGLTMYELSSSGSLSLPAEGARWHEIRNGAHVPELPSSRSKSLVHLIQKMISPNKEQRPTAKEILGSNDEIVLAGSEANKFLADYITDVQNFDEAREREVSLAQKEADQSRHTPTPLLNRRGNSSGGDLDRSWNVRTPTPGSGSGTS